jgi:hypothetical protein
MHAVAPDALALIRDYVAFCTDPKRTGGHPYEGRCQAAPGTCFVCRGNEILARALLAVALSTVSLCSSLERPPLPSR